MFITFNFVERGPAIADKKLQKWPKVTQNDTKGQKRDKKVTQSCKKWLTITKCTFSRHKNVAKRDKKLHKVTTNTLDFGVYFPLSDALVLDLRYQKPIAHGMFEDISLDYTGYSTMLTVGYMFW